MNIFEKWKDKATRYVDVRVQLAKLTFIERASHVLGTLISTFILLFLGLASLIFLGFSLMEFFTSLLDGNRTGGALLTTAFFALLAGIMVALRKSVINAFAGMFIKIMTYTDEEDEANERARKVKVESDDDDDNE